MVSSINSADPNIMQLMAGMYQKMSAADTDGSGSLSKAELSSIASNDSADSSPFLKALVEKFDDIDSDGDGQLSAKEIGAIRPHGPLGPPPGLDLGDELSTKEIGSIRPHGPVNQESDSDSANVTNVQSASAAKSPDGVSSTDPTSSNSSIEAMIEKVLNQLMEAVSKGAEKLADEINSKSNSSSVDKLASADTDGKAGLSVAELSSIDTSKDIGRANFIKNLTENFAKFDTNGDGQLSKDEIIASKSTKNPTATGANSIASGLNALGGISGAFAQKLINSYQNGGLSNLASSLNLAV